MKREFGALWEIKGCGALVLKQGVGRKDGWVVATAARLPSGSCHSTSS